MTPDEIQALQKEPKGEIMKYQELIRTIEEKHIQDYCPCDEHGKDPQWKCLGCAQDGLDVVYPCDVIKVLDAWEAERTMNVAPLINAYLKTNVYTNLYTNEDYDL